MSVKRLFAAYALATVVLVPASALAQQSNQNQQRQMSEQEAQRAAREAEQRARAQEAAVQAQMKQIEAGIAHQEKLLERRMAEAGRLRAAALEKNDQRGLDRAAEYEKQAIAAYEAAINQLVQAINNPAAAQKNAQGSARGSQQQRRQPPQRQQRRRSSGWSWWPFG